MVDVNDATALTLPGLVMLEPCRPDRRRSEFVIPENIDPLWFQRWAAWTWAVPAIELALTYSRRNSDRLKAQATLLRHAGNVERAALGKSLNTLLAALEAAYVQVRRSGATREGRLVGDVYWLGPAVTDEIRHVAAYCLSLGIAALDTATVLLADGATLEVAFGTARLLSGGEVLDG